MLTVKAGVPRHELMELVRNAVLAPSGHNTQPWHFTISPERIDIRADLSRRLPVVDPDDHALFISLGAALENLRITALQTRIDAEPELFPTAAPDSLVVHLARMARPAASQLFRAIPERQSTRSTYDGRAIPAADLRKLEDASVQEGVRFRLFTERGDLRAVTALIEEGNRLQMKDAAFVQELLDWVRFSRAEAAAHNDGLIAPVMGMPSVPRWLGERIMRLMLRPASEARRAAKLVRSSAALMLFVAERNDRAHWVRLGQSFERVALTATTLGIRHAHMNMPCEVLEVRRQFQEFLGFDGEHPLLLLRIGYGPLMPRSPRRPLPDVTSQRDT